MAYVSKIRIGTTNEGFTFLRNYVKEAMKETGFSYSYMENYKVFAKTHDTIFIGWDWVNFYDERPDVKAIYEALGIMEEEEISYRMAKVGEDYAEYGAIEIIDADPFDIVPHIYTNIGFDYDIDDKGLILYNGILTLKDEVISICDKDFESSIAFGAADNEFKEAYRENPHYFTDEIIITLHTYFRKKEDKLREAEDIIIFDSRYTKEEDYKIVADYIKKTVL